MGEPKSVVGSRTLRWFAAEFFVVVTGVIVALGATSWWEGRQSRAQEIAYIDQLRADVDQTLALIAEADAEMSDGDEASGSLVRAFEVDPTPPVDSIVRWADTAFDWGASPRMVVATAEALMATGDLTLIESDALRIGIVTYLEAARGNETRNRSDFEFYRLAIQRVLEEVDLRGVAFPTSRTDFRQNRSVYNGASTIFVMRRNEAQRRRAMREEAEALRALIETYRAQENQ